MTSDYITIHQYEPLRTPSNWTGAERNLVRQLSDTFDDLYRRLNRLRFEDLGKDFQKRVEDAEGNLTQVQQTAKSLILAVSGGSQIWHQETAPAPPDQNPLYGDLWYDAEGVCHRYENGQWNPTYDNAFAAVQYTAGLLMTAEQIVSTVRSHEQYQADLSGKLGTGALDDYYTKSVVEDKFTSIDQRAGEIELSVGKKQDIKMVNLNGEEVNYYTLIQSYFTFQADGLHITKDGSNLSTVLSNAKLSFMNGNTEVAYVAGELFSMKNAHIAHTLTIGNDYSTVAGEKGFVDIRIENGGITGSWREASSS